MRDDEKFTPSLANFSKTITVGTFAREILLDQYYFETLFPRIPKTVSDEIQADLRSMNLPTSALGNAGQGGPDRRGADDGRGRPASVKASLAVGFGQRAPNRAGAREVGRGMGSDQHSNRGRDGGGGGRRRSRSPGRRDDHGHGGRSGRGSRRSRSRSRSRDRYGGRSGRPRSRDRGGRDGDRREGVHRDNDYRRGGDTYNDRDYDSYRGGGDDRRGRSRSRSPLRDGGGRGGGRDVRDVFRERPAAPPGGNPNYRNNY
jgi:pre-mRNA-splicing factor 38B